MFPKLCQRRRLGLVPAIVLVTACGGAPASAKPDLSAAIAPAATRAATGSVPAPTSVVAASPTPSTAPVVLDDVDLSEREIQPTASIAAVAPYSLAQAAGYLWVGSPDGLVRIDPKTDKTTIVDPEPGATIVARGGDIWRAALRLDRVTRYVGSSGEVRARVSIPGAFGLSPSGPIWVVERFNGQVDRLYEATGRVLQTVVTGQGADSGTSAILQVGRELWITQVDDRSFARMNPNNGDVLGHVDVGTRPCQQQGVAAGAVWLCQASDGAELTPTVRRLDPDWGTMGPAYLTSAPVTAALEAGGLVWLPIGGRLIGMEPRTGQATRALTVGGLHYLETLNQIIEAYGSIWIGTSAGRVLRFDPAGFR